MGLIDAINKFDLSRNVKFETYSMIRIKGAIIDELRALEWVPRSVRTKSKILEAVYAKLEGTLMRMPTDSEVCAELGIDEVELTDMLRDISLIGIVPLDQTLSHREEAATLGDTMADTDDGPLPMLEVKEVRETLVNIIKQMGSREKTVLTLYYYEGMTLEEIGKVLGVTESRVCQIHTKAVLQLRAKLTTARKMEVQ
jgi:RNA polymerase sigma factor for flagellar operon FliA